MPKMVRASSDRPDPTSPARPTISPRRNEIDRAIRVGRGSYILRHQDFLAHSRLGRRVERLQVTADHQTDHAIVLDLGLLQRPDHRTVAKRHDAIGALLDLVETVGDEDDADAGCLQFRNDLEQTVGLGQGQARRRFVHDHDLGPERERLCDLDQLALGKRERGNRGVGLEVRTEPLEQRPGVRHHSGAVDQPEQPE